MLLQTSDVINQKEKLNLEVVGKLSKYLVFNNGTAVLNFVGQTPRNHFLLSVNLLLPFTILNLLEFSDKL